MQMRLLLVIVLAGWATATVAGQFTELENKLGRDPAAVVTEVAALKALPDQAPAVRAELQLLAGAAQLILTRGRDALTEADAGLALLPIAAGPEPMPLTPLAVRLQLVRAQALDLLGQTASGLAPLAHLLDELLAVSPAAAETNQLLAEALAARATLLLTLNDRRAALTDLQQAYSLAQVDNPWVSRGDIAGIMANLYNQQGDNENALRYHQEAVKIFQQNQADVKLSIEVFGVGATYRDLQNWSEARRYFGWSLELSRQRDDLQGIAYAQQQLASVAIETGQLDEAESLLEAAEPLFKQEEDYAMLINTLVSRADLAGQRGRWSVVMQFLQEAEQLADRKQLQWKKPKIWKRRAELLAQQKRYAEAYEAYKTFHQENEATFRRESDRQLQELRVRFDSERQEQQNELLRQQNQLQQTTLQQQHQRTWLYIVVALLSLISTVFLLYAIYKGKQVRLKLNALAHTDELTGLPNRRHLMKEAEMEVERARRYHLPLCLAVLDLDWFKTINDRFGHAAGDEVLRQFATLCQRSLRKTDQLGRVGGEEFVLILPHTNLLVARQILERLREDFKTVSIPALANSHQPSTSIGVTALAEADEGLADLLRRADEALYTAKQTGRDRVCVAEHSHAVAVGSRAGESGAQYEKF